MPHVQHGLNSIPLTLQFKEDKPFYQLCRWRRYLPLFLWELVEICIDNPTPWLSPCRTVPCMQGLQNRALYSKFRPRTTSTTPTAGRLRAWLLRDVRIHFQAWVLKTHSIFPTSFGSEIIAKETSATNSAFLFLYWVKHELKMGGWQMMEETSMEKTDHK